VSYRIGERTTAVITSANPVCNVLKSVEKQQLEIKLENKQTSRHEHGEKCSLQMKAHAYIYTDEWIEIDLRNLMWL